ncbi:hypothetical protein FRE64_00975 [Euhalothece natronophila Z-M001]|uniref:DnaD domain protein n=1 Tax=Euhalothece natronophila Z-M001 TaxID=522448 RepID=A0A5B8NJV7_9CHRO|nr:hypothetical protein [Euhalothece natronophila]QDZ38640.1 hypothetical protein FRE64_00975 [Euhalothece natronophila Z-M001]
MQQLIEVLIENYGFELQGETPQELAQRWLENYEPRWVRLAIIEALYLGRYKVFSVEQILSLWARRGQSKIHFTHEFEHLICRRLPKALREFSEEAAEEMKEVSPPQPLSEPSPVEDEELITEEAEEENEEEEEIEPFSIDRFTPLFDRTHFYSKLKAVADYQNH